MRTLAGKQIAGRCYGGREVGRGCAKCCDDGTIPDKTKAQGRMELIAFYGYRIFGRKKTSKVFGVLDGVIHEKDIMGQ